MSRDQKIRIMLKAIKEHQKQIKINELMRNVMKLIDEENYLTSLNLKYVGEKQVDEIFFDFITGDRLLNEVNFDKILELFIEHLQQNNLVMVVRAGENR